jgi:S1-C subfamily serine protease
MTNHALPPSSRVCPECGRRVPGKLPFCRCGHALEVAETAGVGAVDRVPQRAGRNGRSSFITGVVVAAGACLTLFFSINHSQPPGPGIVIEGTKAPATTRPVAPMADSVAVAPVPQFAVLPSGELPEPVVVANSATVPPAPPLRAAEPSPLEDVISRAMPAVVRVESAGGFGSGFFVAPDTILTNVHVVGRNTSVTIRRTDGRTIWARVDTTAPELDIAIVRISNPDPDQPTLTMGSGAGARAGQEIIALGTPLGLQNTVTRGIVSAVREVGGVTLVQTDAAINPGNSGGPLLDRAGLVIAIATMSMRSTVAQGLSFGIAIEHAQGLLAGRRSSAIGTPVASLNQAMSGKQGPTESDSIREAGGRTYEEAIAVLARRSDVLDGRWRSFKSSCYEGRIAGSFDHDWFALLDQRAMQGAVSPGCGQSFADIQRIAQDIRDDVLGAGESARKAGVYPGTLREVRRRHRLEHPGWDR